jgi:hypothetical protein
MSCRWIGPPHMFEAWKEWKYWLIFYQQCKQRRGPVEDSGLWLHHLLGAIDDSLPAMQQRGCFPHMFEAWKEWKYWLIFYRQCKQRRGPVEDSGLWFRPPAWGHGRCRSRWSWRWQWTLGLTHIPCRASFKILTYSSWKIVIGLAKIIVSLKIFIYFYFIIFVCKF